MKYKIIQYLETLLWGRSRSLGDWSSSSLRPSIRIRGDKYSLRYSHSVSISLAMAHRGRFPIMLSILDYPPADLFRKIMGRSDMPEEYTAGVIRLVKFNFF